MSKAFAPNRSYEAAMVRSMAKFERMAMSPGTAHKHFANLRETDVRDVLGSVRVPTLILHRTGDRAMPVGHARFIAERIHGAKLVELPGDDFADMVDSTSRAAALGDQAWNALLTRFYAIADERLRVHRGRKLDTAGDGLFAAFDGPARAVRCGLALCSAMATQDVQLRVGVHTGECEVLGDKYSGIAVHVGARVAGAAEPGQVVVSSTVRDLVAGAGLRFEDLGAHALKGVPQEWRLYRALADGEATRS